MASEIAFLFYDFRVKLLDAIEKCKEENVIITPYVTLVTPQEQAVLWREGRTKHEAQIKIKQLESAGAPFLAECIRIANPLKTNKNTNFLPGFSWHQWGNAALCIWINEGKLIWYPKSICNINGYDVLYRHSIDVGLFSGQYDTPPNINQIRLFSKMPNEIMDIKQIDAEMKKRFESTTY